MKTWLRRNWLAFAIIAVMIALIAGTITYPEWSRRLGFRNPEQAVAAGEWMDIGGTRWRLSPVTIPPAAPSQFATANDKAPSGSKLASYLLERRRDGKNAGLPDGFRFCGTSLVDGARRWTASATPFNVYTFAERKGYTTLCDEYGPLLVAKYVPEDAAVTGVEVLLQPGDKPASTENDENAPVFESYDQSPVVVRFETG